MDGMSDQEDDISDSWTTRHRWTMGPLLTLYTKNNGLGPAEYSDFGQLFGANQTFKLRVVYYVTCVKRQKGECH